MLANPHKVEYNQAGMAELQIIKDKGIYYRHYAIADPKAAIILLYGLGASNVRWKFQIDHLTENGYACYAMEMRGYGESPDQPRGHIDSYTTYFQDVLAMLELVRRENPGKKVFLLGDSMGGLIYFMTAAREPACCDGLILTCPFFKTSLALPLPMLFSIFFSMLYDQRKQFNMPFNASMITRDQAYMKVVESDPRESRLATSGQLVRTQLEQLRARAAARKIKISVLFLLSGTDLLTDIKESRAVFKRLKTTDKTLIEYPEMLHNLAIDIGKEKVFSDILAWLDKRV